MLQKCTVYIRVVWQKRKRCSCLCGSADGVSLRLPLLCSERTEEDFARNMAAYIRSMTCLLATEHHLFSSRGGNVLVETKRYVRGLRRRPVNVFFPENDAEKAAKTAAQSAVQTIAGKRDRKPAGAEKQRAGGDFSKARSNFHPVKNDPHVTVTKEDIDGLHFERAHPGDKRLG